jgi:hypothetical protein
LRRSWLALFAFVPSLALAQSPGDRAALGAWDDSLRAAMTVAELAVLEHHHGGASVDGLRQMALTLRRGELSGSRGDLELILTDAAWITKTRHDWAWPYYLAARASAAMQIHEFVPHDVEAGEDTVIAFADNTWRDLRTALQYQPDFPQAERFLTPLLVAGGDRVLRDDERAALQPLVERPAPNPDALLVWGRYLRTYHAYDSALVVFNRALALGGDSSRLDLERARTLRALHDSVHATAAYWRGLAHLTPVGRVLYHDDLSWIIAPDSLAAFDRLAAGNVMPWMQRFWNQRDAAAVLDPGARLNEHLRRWVVAFGRYRVLSPWRRVMHHQIDVFYENEDCMHMEKGLYELLWRIPPSDDGDLRRREWLLDHRGILYLRHGEPLKRFGGMSIVPDPEDFLLGPHADSADHTGVWSDWQKGGGQRLGGNLASASPADVGLQEHPTHLESWLYLVDDQYRMVTFRDSRALGNYAATTMTSYVPYSANYLLALSGTLPEYHTAGERIVKEGPIPRRDVLGPSCWDEVRAAAQRSRRDATATVTTDTDSPPIVLPWQSTIQMFALGGGDERNGEAFITYAVGSPAMKSQLATDGSTIYPVHFRVVAWEKHTGQTITVDTLRGFVIPHLLGVDQQLISWLEIPLPPGDWQIATRVKQENDSSGAYAIRDDVHIDAGPAVAVSDVVLGRTGAAPWTATDGGIFPVNTTHRWPVGGSAELYYEVHGVPTSAPYRATIEVRPVDTHIKQTIRITTDEQSLGAVTHMRRTLGLQGLAPGNYQLTITIDAAGQHASRTEPLIVDLPPH